MTCIILFLLAITIVGTFVISWAIQPENLREVKNQIQMFLFRNSMKDSYNADSLLLVDLSNDNIFISKKESERRIPASLAKLFVVEYAATISDLDSIVSANDEAIALTKQGSSVAGITSKDYYLHNLFAAMLVPSGNDAAYVVADYCGGLLFPQAATSQERIEIFMKNLANHMQSRYDPI